ncbi:phosphotransferase [Prauserella sp. ASG 168]|uniref:Phosphotransferase n=1 Tax=Prauserella cavernicola TaxID=2800127 RepID=A0A934QTB2_9PSEU|nr:phosphotransferase [Prauserella cavernicola]
MAAAVGAGRAFGLTSAEPVVLADRSNVLVRLGHVVARVPATTLLTRPDAANWLARDVRLAGFLDDLGAPVIPPSDDPPPGPHLVSGLPVTFWRYVRHDPGSTAAPAEVAGSLAELHEALRGYPGELPGDGPVGELRRMFGLLTDELGAALPELRVRLDALDGALGRAPGPVQPLHGDAHPGNLLLTADGPRWTDFEDTWRGPLAWDLAVLAGTSRLDGAEALAAYPGAPPAAELAPCGELRTLFGVCWRFVLARRFPGVAPEARQALADYLD